MFPPAPAPVPLKVILLPAPVTRLPRVGASACDSIVDVPLIENELLLKLAATGPAKENMLFCVKLLGSIFTRLPKLKLGAWKSADMLEPPPYSKKAMAML